jgi:hypothetical protein
VIDTVPADVAATRCGLFVKDLVVGGVTMLLTAVALPPEPVLKSERSSNAPGTGCGVGVELSKAVTVKVTCCPVVKLPVTAIGLSENR